MLEPVDHEQQLPTREPLEQHLARIAPGVVGQLQGAGEGVLHQARVPHRRQLHQPGAVARGGGGGRPHREPRLADPADPGHRHQASRGQRIGHRAQFARAPDEGGELGGQVPGGGGRGGGAC
ncbi:hypothetical protein RB200_40375 [Streptomyces sp. PmtG]